MNFLLITLPFLIAYVLLRAYMHQRAGRKNWRNQMYIIAGFMTCVLLLELWLKFSGGD